MNENLQLYRWDFKAASATAVEMPGTKNKVNRIFFQMTYLISLVKNFSSAKQYLLCKIKTTLCLQGRTDFDVYNEATNQLECWELCRLKYFYCDLDTKVDPSFKTKVWQIYDQRRWIYNKDRMIPRDIHNPGNLSENKEAPSIIQQKYDKWQRIPGMRFEFETNSVVRKKRQETLLLRDQERKVKQKCQEEEKKRKEVEKEKLKKRQEEEKEKARLEEEKEKNRLIEREIRLQKETKDKRRKLPNNNNIVKTVFEDNKRLEEIQEEEDYERAPNKKKQGAEVKKSKTNLLGDNFESSYFITTPRQQLNCRPFFYGGTVLIPK